MEVAGFGETIKTTATEIHIFNSPVSECSAGQHVGILARGVKPGNQINFQNKHQLYVYNI